MKLVATTLQLPVDGRQSDAALKIARGTSRLLHAHGFCVVSELPLPSGRRADLVALASGGEIWIVEIKSSVADFRADQKWQDYRTHCDRLFFATHLEVPCEIFPPDTGLIVADAFGAEFKCQAPEHRLPAAGCNAQGDDADVRPRRRFAFAVARRSNRAVWRCGLKLTAARAFSIKTVSTSAEPFSPESAAACGGAC